MMVAIQMLCGLFQSTLPARGATLYRNNSNFFRLISIHAPRTGSDEMFPRCPYCDDISIHAPRTGSDAAQSIMRARGGYISIHAPRTGSDCRAVPYAPHGCFDFNPRSPHGERRDDDIIRRQHLQFQSTLPARGATGIRVAMFVRLSFQSTLPARGATRDARQDGGGSRNFNPRSPHGERQSPRTTVESARHFNPRSPHGERQYGDLFSTQQQQDFNPRSPHGERR